MTGHTAKCRKAKRPAALPARILLVDDDDLELELMADRLKSIGFEVATAMNGHDALELLSREWFPLLITDREMPGMDGIQLIEQLRARGVDDVYVIMLTVRDTGVDYERGYLAGADDYLTKKLPDAELLARVQKGFTTLGLRRSRQQARSDLAQQGPVDPESGAYTREHLLSVLQSECRRAERYGRNLSVMTVAIETGANVSAAMLRRVADTIRAAVREHVDWIARIDAVAGEPAFVVVLPEATTADAVGIKQRLQTTLRLMAERFPDTTCCREQLRFTFGFAALDPSRSERKSAEAIELVNVAEHCRACLRCHGERQLAAVQASVAQTLAICCRHGYVVESQCHFMSETPLPAAVAENPAA